MKCNNTWLDLQNIKDILNHTYSNTVILTHHWRVGYWVFVGSTFSYQLPIAWTGQSLLVEVGIFGSASCNNPRVLKEFKYVKKQHKRSASSKSSKATRAKLKDVTSSLTHCFALKCWIYKTIFDVRKGKHGMGRWSEEKQTDTPHQSRNSHYPTSGGGVIVIQVRWHQAKEGRRDGRAS